MAIGALASVMPWQDPGLEKVKGRYYGEYLGFVRNRMDPTLSGRVCVHVPSLTADDNIEENWLDWCVPKSGSTNLVVPPLNAPVCVTFEHGMITHGLYTWGWIPGGTAALSMAPVAGKGLAADPSWVQSATYTTGSSQGSQITHKITQDPALDTLPQYPYDKVWQSEGGMILEVDDSPNSQRARFYHPAGTTILVDKDGSIQLRSAGAIFHESTGDYVIGLKPGATFKVIYNGGSGISVGSDGVHIEGHQVDVMGRAVSPNGRVID